MSLISVIGDVGSGKTLFATYIALHDPRKVYSNYKIKRKKWELLKPETLVKLQSESLVIIDEAYAWLESRLSGRNINLYLSYILFQSRKRKMDIILTEQLESTIDVRYRNMINYEVICEKDVDGFHYQLLKYGRKNGMAKLFMPYSVAEKIFPKYNTLELINPIDENMIFDIAEDKDDYVKTIDKTVNKLLKKAPPKAWKKGMVEDYCLRNRLPKAFVQYIYNAIQAKRLEEYED